MRFRGKVAVISGASRGIGMATAQLMGREGAIVVVNYKKNQEAAEIKPIRSNLDSSTGLGFR